MTDPNEIKIEVSEYQEMARALDSRDAEVSKLRADVERLRWALVNVRDHSGGCFPADDRPMCAHCIAVAALAETKPAELKSMTVAAFMDTARVTAPKPATLPRVLGGEHLRPDGEACSYLAFGVCNKCGAVGLPTNDGGA